MLILAAFGLGPGSLTARFQVDDLSDMTSLAGALGGVVLSFGLSVCGRELGSGGLSDPLPAELVLARYCGTGHCRRRSA